MSMVLHDDCPWLELERLVNEGDARRLKEFLESLSPAEVVRGVSRLDDARRLVERSEARRCRC